MDGNRRWAKTKGFSRAVGHKIGFNKILDVVKRCIFHNIEVVSVFAFSTENWNREQAEIDDIFNIVKTSLPEMLPKLQKFGVRVQTMGDISAFDDEMRGIIKKVCDETAKNKTIILNLCVNYGGRADIVRAANLAISSGAKTITEEAITRNLYGANLPAPDLVVRTSGEQRISNFMLWQMAYSEFLFVKSFWPEMTSRTVDKCVAEYLSRNRRFGRG
jgi:undecaprenyl diphosphate synthase